MFTTPVLWARLIPAVVLPCSYMRKRNKSEIWGKKEQHQVCTLTWAVVQLHNVLLAITNLYINNMCDYTLNEHLATSYCTSASSLYWRVEWLGICFLSQSVTPKSQLTIHLFYLGQYCFRTSLFLCCYICAINCIWITGYKWHFTCSDPVLCFFRLHHQWQKEIKISTMVSFSCSNPALVVSENETVSAGMCVLLIWLETRKVGLMAMWNRWL